MESLKEVAYFFLVVFLYNYVQVVVYLHFRYYVHFSVFAQFGILLIDNEKGRMWELFQVIWSRA